MLSHVIDFLIPPIGLVLLLAVALLLSARFRLWRGVAIAACAGMLLLSMPAVSETLIALLETDIQATPATPAPDMTPGAIVILSADVDRLRDGTGDVGSMTLERERAGAALARRTGLPVLVTGGIVSVPPAVGLLMQTSMKDDFGITPRWVEAKSLTTWENATYSAPMLKADGVGTIYLVTHAWHMRRALVAFRHAGLKVVAAPLRLDPWPAFHLGLVLPRTSSWERSYLALHEWIGLAYYKWRA